MFFFIALYVDNKSHDALLTPDYNLKIAHKNVKLLDIYIICVKSA